MHSLISIVGVVLTGKEKYKELSRNIRHNLIFNDLWNGASEGKDDNTPTKPTSDKEQAIWKNKDTKAYALIATFLSEEVSHHIVSITSSFGVLKKLKDLYESH